MKAAGPPPRVLVVDGDDNVLRLLDLKLSRAGFVVDTETEGETGYIRARIGEVDVVLVGDSLGPLNGHSLVRALADLPVRPAIIFLSSGDADDDIARAVRAGCDDYILKPFSPHEVVHRVRVTIVRQRCASEVAP